MADFTFINMLTMMKLELMHFISCHI